MLPTHKVTTYLTNYLGITLVIKGVTLTLNFSKVVFVRIF